MRLLDLFCGAGGAAMGYYRAGFTNITGVDIKPQPRYPFKFIQADALEFPLEGYDFIHASPPCQAYSIMNNIHKSDKHPDLVGETRERLIKSGKPWVIENVIGSPLKTPILLCGTMFGLRIPKHRLFETSFDIFSLMPSCYHADVYDPYHGGEMARGEKEKLAEAIGIERFMTRPEVREAIPPAYTEWIGKQFLSLKTTPA